MGYTPTFSSKAKLMWDRLQDRVKDPVAQRRLVLIVVCIALLLDNMLYMVIVPIIPNFLRAMHETIPAAPNDPPPTPQTTVTNLALSTWYANGSYYIFNTQTNLTYQYTTPKPTKVPPPPVTYGNEGGAIGILFASKAIVQLCVNPFTGTLIDRIGYDVPMMIGLGIMFLSTSVFAFGKSYVVLFIARSMQGLGSAFADTSGLAMIADRFSEEDERTKALGIALAFISFGSLFAPPLGGILYQFAGKTVPFLVLASICLIDGVLLLTVMKPVRGLHISMLFADNGDRPKGTPIYRLLLDPYIAVCAGALAMSNVSLAFLEPTISLWMKDRMQADEWEIGFVWLPAFIPHIAGVYLTVKLAKDYPHHQWLLAAIGLTIEGVFCFFIPFAKAYFVVIFPIMGICFGIALVDTALLPMLGYFVDVRYVSVYGSVYAIADISYSLAYAFGPIVAGSVVHAIGFLWLNVLIFLSNVGYAPVLLLLRKAYKYDRFEDEEDVLVPSGDGFAHPDYKTYVQNGGLDGKPQPINSSGDDFANHLKISKDRPLYSGEIDCYPPTNDMDYGYGTKEPPSFYHR